MEGLGSHHGEDRLQGELLAVGGVLGGAGKGLLDEPVPVRWGDAEQGGVDDSGIEGAGGRMAVRQVGVQAALHTRQGLRPAQQGQHQGRLGDPAAALHP